MPVYETFSRRRDAAARAGQPEVYIYDKLPERLLGQVTLIWDDMLPNNAFKIGDNYSGTSEFWEIITKVFMREYGYRDLPGRYSKSSGDKVAMRSFFLNDATTDQRFDLIEMTFRLLQRTELVAKKSAVDELNQRFRLAGVGYQFEGEQLIRLDSTVAHEELVKPALRLLGRAGFEKADEQYREAHAHYRAGEHSQAITSAAKAFESVLKAVCTLKKWEYESGARASDLITTIMRNGLFPDWLEKGLTSYVAMLKTGLPTVRNEVGAHGPAPDATKVREHLARYALHMAAANILLVADAARE